MLPIFDHFGSELRLKHGDFPLATLETLKMINFNDFDNFVEKKAENGLFSSFPKKLKKLAVCRNKQKWAI